MPTRIMWLFLGLLFVGALIIRALLFHYYIRAKLLNYCSQNLGRSTMGLVLESEPEYGDPRCDHLRTILLYSTHSTDGCAECCEKSHGRTLVPVCNKARGVGAFSA